MILYRTLIELNSWKNELDDVLLRSQLELNDSSALKNSVRASQNELIRCLAHFEMVFFTEDYGDVKRKIAKPIRDLDTALQKITFSMQKFIIITDVSIELSQYNINSFKITLFTCGVISRSIDAFFRGEIETVAKMTSSRITFGPQCKIELKSLLRQDRIDPQMKVQIARKYGLTLKQINNWIWTNRSRSKKASYNNHVTYETPERENDDFEHFYNESLFLNDWPIF